MGQRGLVEKKNLPAKNTFWRLECILMSTLVLCFKNGSLKTYFIIILFTRKMVSQDC